MLTGGCFCKQVRYEADGAPFHPTICHCADCRRVVGAHVVAWFSVPRASLRWTAAAPSAFKSSPPVTRRFCGTCGTALSFESDTFADEVDITIASLDDPAAIAPKDHTQTSGKLAWDVICDGLQSFANTRTGR